MLVSVCILYTSYWVILQNGRPCPLGTVGPSDLSFWTKWSKMRNRVCDECNHAAVKINPLSAYIMIFRTKYTCKMLIFQFLCTRYVKPHVEYLIGNISSMWELLWSNVLIASLCPQVDVFTFLKVLECCSINKHLDAISISAIFRK